MAIDYSYIRHGSNKGPNAAWMAQTDQRASLLNQRQESEAYRMASQANPNFGRMPQEALQEAQATTPPTTTQSQPTGPFSGFAEGYGGKGFDGSFGPAGSGGTFQGLLGSDRNMAGLASFGLNAAGAPFGGILGQALFGDEAGMKNAVIGTGLGTLASMSGSKLAGGLVGPASKALQGQPLGMMDVVNSLMSLNPATRTAMGIYNTGKTLMGLYGAYDKKNKQKTTDDYYDNQIEQAMFDTQPAVQDPSTIGSLFDQTDAPNMATTENTYDGSSPFSTEFSYDSFDPLDTGGGGLGLGAPGNFGAGEFGDGTDR